MHEHTAIYQKIVTKIKMKKFLTLVLLANKDKLLQVVSGDIRKTSERGRSVHVGVGREINVIEGLVPLQKRGRTRV